MGRDNIRLVEEVTIISQLTNRKNDSYWMKIHTMKSQIKDHIELKTFKIFNKKFNKSRNDY